MNMKTKFNNEAVSCLLAQGENLARLLSVSNI